MASVGLGHILLVFRGWRGTRRHLSAICVAGVALGDIHLRFAWQAWHLWHCVARLDGLVAGDAVALCAAGVALMAIYLRFAWQALHLETILQPRARLLIIELITWVNSSYKLIRQANFGNFGAGS